MPSRIASFVMKMSLGKVARHDINMISRISSRAGRCKIRMIFYRGSAADKSLAFRVTLLGSLVHKVDFSLEKGL